jgi:hypothetical protein
MHPYLEPAAAVIRMTDADILARIIWDRQLPHPGGTEVTGVRVGRVGQEGSIGGDRRSVRDRRTNIDAMDDPAVLRAEQF